MCAYCVQHDHNVGHAWQIMVFFILSLQTASQGHKEYLYSYNAPISHDNMNYYLMILLKQ